MLSCLAACATQHLDKTCRGQGHLIHISIRFIEDVHQRHALLGAIMHWQVWTLCWKKKKHCSAASFFFFLSLFSFIEGAAWKHDLMYACRFVKLKLKVRSGVFFFRDSPWVTDQEANRQFYCSRLRWTTTWVFRWTCCLPGVPVWEI